MKSLVSNSLSGFSTVSFPTFVSLKQNLREDEVMLDFFHIMSSSLTTHIMYTMRYLLQQKSLRFLNS